MSTASVNTNFDYSCIDPLDWAQWRALLWDVLPGMDMSDPNCWKTVAAAVEKRCPASERQDGQVFQQAFRNLEHAGFLDGKQRLTVQEGMQIWSDSLYGQVPALLGIRPWFMNLGYAGPLPAATVPLDPLYVPYLLNVQLYRRVLGQLDLKDRRLLEVGCGYGGGCAFIQSYYSPSQLVGVDAAAPHIEACREHFGETGIHFQVADAQRLPFGEETWDAVLSVESSLHYGSAPQFLSEVYRVLRGGGTFLLADLRPIGEDWGPGRRMDDLRRQIGKAGFQLDSAINLSEGVLASLKAQDEAWPALFEARGMHGAALRHFREIMFIQGSGNRAKLECGDIQYWRFECSKPLV